MSMSESKDTNEYKLDKKWGFYIHLHNTDD